MNAFSKRHFVALIVAVLLVGGSIAGFLAGRGEQSAEAQREAPIKPPERIKMVGGETVLTLDPDTQKAGGIAVAELPQVRVQAPLTGYGTVLDLQPLADLANRLATAKADRDIATAKLVASRTAYERAKGLYQDRQNISAAQFQAAEAAFRTDQAGLSVAESRLSTLGTTAVQAWGPVLGRAVTDDSSLLARLLNRDEVLVQVTLPPDRPLAAAPAGATAEGQGEVSVPLTLVSPATRTDPRIQGASFFYTAPGDSGLLPGANVSVHLPAGPAVEGVAVPRSAVVWWQGRAWVYLQTGPETFVRRDVATDVPADRDGYLVAGLPQPTRVVIQGAQALLSEEFRAQVKVGDEGDGR